MRVRALRRGSGPRAVPGTSALESLTLIGRSQGMSAPEAQGRARALMRAVGLAATADRNAGTVPQVALQRLAFARALMPAPEVLLVDALLPGRDAATRRTLRGLAHARALQGGCVLWASRRLDELQGLADNVTLLVAGRVRHRGGVEALAALAGGWAPAA